MMKVVITGAGGLIGRHAHTRLHAANCAAKFKGDSPPYEIVALDKAKFNTVEYLIDCVRDADAVMHFAGVNRGSDDVIETANPNIASQLADACRIAETSPHIIYANSVHSRLDTVYGRSKKNAGEILEKLSPRYSNLVLPHIFGEGARPYYNNVTATLIDQIHSNEPLTIDDGANVNLLHAGRACELAIGAFQNDIFGEISPDGVPMKVTELSEKLLGFQASYSGEAVPQLESAFEVALFNTYRSAIPPSSWPRKVSMHADHRGVLFEAVKGASGQAFVSTTKPGIMRGNHFHISKIERFLVIQGTAIIRIRRVLGEQVTEFEVNGVKPTFIDMPTLHTHHIENTGPEPLITMFWSNEIFDPAKPDTYADEV